MSLVLGDFVNVTEMSVTLTYRVYHIDSIGIHVELINKPWLKYLLVRKNAGYVLYQNHGLVTVSMIQKNIIPAYNPELTHIDEQDKPL